MHDVASAPPQDEVSREIEKIEIFPNPIHKGQQLQINGLFESAEMLNAMGEIINTWNSNNKEAIIISDQAPGIYFLRIRKNSSDAETIKIIIE